MHTHRGVPAKLTLTPFVALNGQRAPAHESRHEVWRAGSHCPATLSMPHPWAAYASSLGGVLLTRVAELMYESAGNDFFRYELPSD